MYLVVPAGPVLLIAQMQGCGLAYNIVQVAVRWLASVEAQADGGVRVMMLIIGQGWALACDVASKGHMWHVIESVDRLRRSWFATPH